MLAPSPARQGATEARQGGKASTTHIRAEMRIVVYGSASKDTPQAFKDASFELGKLLAQRGHVCVNGGGNTGCMGSLSDGCLQNGGKVVGVIHEMFVVDGEEHTGVSEMLLATGDGLADRKRLLMQGCDAVIGKYRDVILPFLFSTMLYYAVNSAPFNPAHEYISLSALLLLARQPFLVVLARSMNFGRALPKCRSVSRTFL